MHVEGFGKKERSLVAALTDVGAMLESQPCKLREIFFAACPGHSLIADDGCLSSVRYGIEKTPFNILLWDKLTEKFASDIHVIIYRDLDDVLLSAKEIWHHGWAGYTEAVLDLIELYPHYERLLARYNANPGAFFLLHYSSMPEDVERCIAEISGGAYIKHNRSIEPLPGRLGDPKQATNFRAAPRKTIDPISYLELRIFFHHKATKPIRITWSIIFRSIGPFLLLLYIVGFRAAKRQLLGYEAIDDQLSKKLRDQLPLT